MIFVFYPYTNVFLEAVLEVSTRTLVLVWISRPYFSGLGNVKVSKCWSLGLVLVSDCKGLLSVLVSEDDEVSVSDFEVLSPTLVLSTVYFIEKDCILHYNHTLNFPHLLIVGNSCEAILWQSLGENVAVSTRFFQVDYLDDSAHSRWCHGFYS